MEFFKSDKDEDRSKKKIDKKEKKMVSFYLLVYFRLCTITCEPGRQAATNSTYL